MPQRIISLVPSQTELLVDLGLGERIVGVTKFCIHPKGFKQTKQIIGGTKNFDFKKIYDLNPDLIIGNKEENYREGIEKLASQFPVWISDIVNLEDAYQMMTHIGEITQTNFQAKSVIDNIKIELSRGFSYKGSAVYLIWNNPIMAVGQNTFIDDLMRIAGYSNLVTDHRYPEITLPDLKLMQPESLLLSSEPFPFSEKHVSTFQQALPNTAIKLVDGEMFSWYGSRLIQAGSYFSTL